MDYDKLEKLARGRVYTGAMATKLGLVDELGTLDDAVKYAAKAAGLPKRRKDRTVDSASRHEPARIDFWFKRFRRRSRRPVSRKRSPKRWDSFRPSWPKSSAPLTIFDLLAREPRLTLMPFQIRVR